MGVEGAQPLDGGTSRSSEAESEGGTGRGGGGEETPSRPTQPHTSPNRSPISAFSTNSAGGSNRSP